MLLLQSQVYVNTCHEIYFNLITTFKYFYLEMMIMHVKTINMHEFMYVCKGKSNQDKYNNLHNKGRDKIMAGPLKSMNICHWLQLALNQALKQQEANGIFYLIILVNEQ